MDHICKYICVLSNIYNMSGRVVSDIQTRGKCEWLYILYNTDANVTNIPTLYKPRKDNRTFTPFDL